jgi:hypothetical protein
MSDWFDEHDGDGGIAPPVVRPYFITKGRTRAKVEFPLETLIVTSPRGEHLVAHLGFEQLQIAELCRAARSVAEIASLLAIPLGVARVVLGDMAEDGLIKVYEPGSRDDTALLRRLIDGIRAL